MTKRQKMTFTPQVDGLERREVLSTFINTSIPIVHAPAGVHQNAINFTSNTFHQVLNSLNAGAKRFAHAFNTGNVTNIEAQLTALSRRVPYGRQALLDTWLADVESAVGTGTSPAAVARQIAIDLIDYLNVNEGTALNVGKSGVNFSTDALLTYNYRVGHRPPNGQVTVIGVTLP